MYSLDWTPAGGLSITVRGQLTADGVVEYENSGCAGPVLVRFVSWWSQMWGVWASLGTYTSLSSCSVSL